MKSFLNQELFVQKKCHVKMWNSFWCSLFELFCHFLFQNICRSGWKFWQKTILNIIFSIMMKKIGSDINQPLWGAVRTTRISLSSSSISSELIPKSGPFNLKRNINVKSGQRLHKSDNFNIIRWVAGTNDSSTKRLMFQVFFFFHNFLQKPFYCFIDLQKQK